MDYDSFWHVYILLQPSIHEVKLEKVNPQKEKEGKTRYRLQFVEELDDIFDCHQTLAESQKCDA